MTINDVLNGCVEKLKKVKVPVELLDEVGVPIVQVINALLGLKEGLEAAQKKREENPDTEPQAIAGEKEETEAEEG